MAVTQIRIHPAIGVARLGNSPDSFFVGPEKPWQAIDPDGGFKDDQGRIKRQAARFRVFAYHDDGTPPQELTADDADITWTVHLANKKAVHINAGASPEDLTIDPGSRSVSAGESARFDDGRIKFGDTQPVTVPLGEIHGEQDGTLLVLGGHGHSDSPAGETVAGIRNPDWYDDASDGPVSAKVHIKSTGQTFSPDEVAGAWVVAGPPKFGANLHNVIDLYDRLYNLAAQNGRLLPQSADSIWSQRPDRPSYTHDIYPILKSARENDWVAPIPKPSIHDWSEPVTDATTRDRIFKRLKAPSQGPIDGPLQPDPNRDMPKLISARLTDVQYEVMRKWKDGNFDNDWNGPPGPPDEITPEGLDLAALRQCVGAAFGPGIEVGGSGVQPIVDIGNYSEPMRLDHDVVKPGDITCYLAVPWQGDFYLCAGRRRMYSSSWWPVPRPNWVFPENASDKQQWLPQDLNSEQDMVDKWHQLEHVVPRNGRHVVPDGRTGGTSATS